MTEAKRKLIECIKRDALMVRQPGDPPFQLSSGGVSDFYLDIRKVALHSNGLNLIVAALWDELYDELCDGIDAVGGPCIGADPIVGALLHDVWSERNTDMRGFLVRKETKNHGAKGRVIGSMQPGDRCLLIEDVVTTGRTSFEAITEIELAGGKVVMATAVIDRRDHTHADVFDARGIPFRPMLTLADLGIEEK